MAKTIAHGSERSVLLECVDRAFSLNSWHGANLLSALRGIPFLHTYARVGRRKTIWEQLLHAGYWKNRVLNSLRGTKAFPRRGSNWPAVLQATPGAWKDDVELLKQLHEELRAVVGKLPGDKFNAKNRRMLLGIAAHDLYHAGQIKLMRRLVGERGRKG